MLKIQAVKVLEKFKPTVKLLEGIVNFGLAIIKGLLDGLSCYSDLRDLLMKNLARPFELIFRQSERLQILEPRSANTLVFDCF